MTLPVAVPTFDELYDAGRSETQARQPALTDWNEGSNLDALTGGGAIQADEVIRVALELYAAQFVDTAEGDDLDALALDRFGLTRKLESKAIGTVRLDLSSGDAIVIPVGTHFSGETNGSTVQVVSTVEAQNIAVGVGLVDVTCEATVAGPAGNIAAEVIDTVDDTIDDPDATCTNLARFTGGTVAETDPEFRARIRAYFQTLRCATVPSLAFGAMTVPGVKYAAVDESNIAPEDGGYVLVVIGDPDARASSALIDLVEAELENWRAAGVRVDVAASVRELISVTMQVRVRSGTDVGTLVVGMRAAVLAYCASLDPGATFYRSAAEAAIFETSDDVLDVTISNPTADYAPTNPYNAVRIESADLSISFLGA